jgi:transposase-like protein
MAKNKIQFQKGYGISDLFREYGTEAQCEEALFKLRCSNGFVCPQCGSESHCTLKTRKLYQCHSCPHQTSLTAGTIFEKTKLALTTWFLGIHLITQSKTGISALELKRQLGVSYNTAWLFKQKVMQVMKERDDGQSLSGIIQLDDVYWGGEHHGGKRGRGASGKKPFVAAVEVNEEGHPVRMYMSVIQGFRKAEISQWANKHLAPDSIVVSDGLHCFNAVTQAGCLHERIVTGSGYVIMTLTEFTWVNTMIGNVKNDINGTYHSFDLRHLPRYLAEFCYRFNRRFQLQDMLPRFLYVALRTPAMPNKLISLAESYG